MHIYPKGIIKTSVKLWAFNINNLLFSMIALLTDMV